MDLLYLEKVIRDFKLEEVRRRLMETRNNITLGVCVIPDEKRKETKKKKIVIFVNP
jgi:hypothetical protein